MLAASPRPAATIPAACSTRWCCCAGYRTNSPPLEPALIAAARAAGVVLAGARSGAGRGQPAGRRTPLPAAAAGPRRRSPAAPATARVRAERDRRAGHRAVAQWANDNTADLRRLAGQITALTDLDDAAARPRPAARRASADADATALPALLAGTHRHLGGHPDLADQIDGVTAHTDEVRRQTQSRRDDPA